MQFRGLRRLICATGVLILFAGHPAEGQTLKPTSEIFREGFEALKNREFKKSVMLFELGTSKSPSNFDGWLYLGDAYLGLNDTSSASRAYLKAKALARGENSVSQIDNRIAKLAPLPQDLLEVLKGLAPNEISQISQALYLRSTAVGKTYKMHASLTKWRDGEKLCSFSDFSDSIGRKLYWYENTETDVVLKPPFQTAESIKKIRICGNDEAHVSEYRDSLVYVFGIENPLFYRDIFFLKRKDKIISKGANVNLVDQLKLQDISLYNNSFSYSYHMIYSGVPTSEALVPQTNEGICLNSKTEIGNNKWSDLSVPKNILLSKFPSRHLVNVDCGVNYDYNNRYPASVVFPRKIILPLMVFDSFFDSYLPPVANPKPVISGDIDDVGHTMTITADFPGAPVVVDGENVTAQFRSKISIERVK